MNKEEIERILAGSPAAIEAFVRKYGSVMRSVTRRCCYTYCPQGRDPTQIIDDLVQDLLLLLMQSKWPPVRRFDLARNVPFEAFLRVWVYWKIILLLRRPRTNPWTETPAEAAKLESLLSSARTQDELIEDRRLLEQVRGEIRIKYTDPDVAESIEQMLILELSADEVIASRRSKDTQPVDTKSKEHRKHVNTLQQRLHRAREWAMTRFGADRGGSDQAQE